MAGALIAVALGVVALLGLTAAVTVPRAWMHTVLAGLPLVAVSGAYLAVGGWNLAIAVGMTVSVVLGMLASMVGPAQLSAPTGHWVGSAWRILAAVVVAVVLGGEVARWAAGLIGPLANLSPQSVAVLVVVAGVAAAAGGAARRGLVSTGTVILLILFLLLVAAGVVAGTPSLLTAPLETVSHPPAAWLLFLVTFILGAANPALREVRSQGGSIVAGTVVLGVVMLVGLVALLSFNGGYIKLPSFGFAIVAGYVSFGSPIAGTVVGVLLTLVAVAVAAVAFHSAFTTLYAFAGSPAAPGGWWRTRWFTAIVIGIAGVAVAAGPLGPEPVLGATAVLVVVGWIVGRTRSDTSGSSDTPTEIDPTPVGRGTSQ